MTAKLRSTLEELHKSLESLRTSQERQRLILETSPIAILITHFDGNIEYANQRFIDQFGLDASRQVMNYYADPVDRQIVLEAIHQQGMFKDYSLRLKKTDGSLVWILLSVCAFDYGGETVLLSSIVDVSEQKKAEEALKRKAQESQALMELSSLLLESGHNYDQVLNLSVQRCAELIGDGASIFLYHPGQPYLELAAVYNPDPEAVSFFRAHMEKYPISVQEGLYGKVISSNEPALIPDIDMEQIIAQATDERRQYYQRLPIYSAMFAPLKEGGVCIGVLGVGVHHPNHPHFTQEDMPFFLEVAHRASIAISKALIYAALENELAERKRAEQALRESEEKFRTIIEQAAEGFVIVDENCTIIEWNRAQERIGGLKREQVLGQPYYDVQFQLVTPERRTPERYEYIRAMALQAARTGQSPLFNQVVEAEICRPDGQRASVQQIIFPIKTSHGHRVASMSLDITERKRTEKALRANEEKFSKAFHTSPDSININRLSDGLYLEINDGFSQLTGYTPEDVAGKTSLEISIWANPDDRARLAQELRQKGEVANLEAQFRLKDGSIKTGLMSATRIEVNGEPCILSITRDISERKRAQDAILRQLALDELLTRLLTRFATCSHDEVNASINIGLQEIAEFTGSDHAYIVVMREDRLAYSVAYEWCAPHVSPAAHNLQNIPLGTRLWSESKLLAGETIRINSIDDYFPAEWENTQSDGAQSVLAMPISSQSPSIAGFIGLHAHAHQITWQDSDVTHLKMVGDAIANLLERQHAEEKARQLNAELEQRVIERTAELEAANQELEAFSYSVSHDLRAPLRGVDGYARYLQEDYGANLPQEANEMLSQIRNSAQRMNQLINDLLNFSRLSRIPLSKKWVEMDVLVQQALRTLSHEQRDRPVEIVAGELPACQGDPDLLLQVWINLLSNALKYTRPRPIARIEVGARTGAKGETVYSVIDNGVGFDMRYADKLFGVFQRLHRADEFEGSGVGLALVQRILQRHGGHIWAEARLGEGAAFYFTVQ
jgi:PAS domain S-box-containing protein